MERGRVREATEKTTKRNDKKPLVLVGSRRFSRTRAHTQTLALLPELFKDLFLLPLPATSAKIVRLLFQSGCCECVFAYFFLGTFARAHTSIIIHRGIRDGPC